VGNGDVWRTPPGLVAKHKRAMPLGCVGEKLIFNVLLIYLGHLKYRAGIQINKAIFCSIFARAWEHLRTTSHRTSLSPPNRQILKLENVELVISFEWRADRESALWCV
jgi:hypothetical protein